MPTGTGETDRAEPAERAPESNSVRFSESQRDADRVRGGDGGDSSDRPESGDRGDSTERPESGDRAEPTERAVVGQPDRLTEHWEFQGYGTMDCAIYSEGTALKAFDKPFDPEQSRKDGEKEGIYTPEDGTRWNGVGRVWERQGMEVERFGPGGTRLEDSTEAFSVMEDRLAEGKAVVVGVDKGPLWNDTRGGHAIWVTGVETSADGEVSIVTNDPGVPDGAGRHYPKETFDKAWRGENYRMFVTRDSFPEREDK